MVNEYNPVISGRIPRSLMEKVSEYKETHSLSNTEVLVKALTVLLKNNVYNEKPAVYLQDNNDAYIQARIEMHERLEGF